MEQRDFNIQFCTQFRDVPVTFPGKNQKKYRDIIFRQYGGRKNEIIDLADTLEQQLDDAGIINRLVFQLEDKNIPAYFALSNVAQTLKRQINYFVRMKPFDTGQYCHELEILKPFNRFIDGFHENLQQGLLNRVKSLRNVQVVEGDLKPVGSLEISRLITSQGKVLKKLNNYYQDLGLFTGHRSNMSTGFDIPTETELNNARLSSFIEKLIHHVRVTQSMLKSWRTTVTSRESAQLLN